MLIFQLLREKNFRLEKIIFLPKKWIYFLTYRNEHPVYINAGHFIHDMCNECVYYNYPEQTQDVIIEMSFVLRHSLLRT